MFTEYKTYRAEQTKRDRLSVYEYLGQSQAPYVLCKMTPCISLHLGAVILSKHEVGITIRENAATRVANLLVVIQHTTIRHVTTCDRATIWFMDCISGAGD